MTGRSGTRDRRGLLVGGVTGLVAGLTLGVGVLALTGGDDGPPPETGGDRHVAADHLCERVDMSAIFALVPPTSDRIRDHVNEADGVTFLECSVDVGRPASVGNVWIDVSVHDSPRLANLRHDTNVNLGRMAEAADTVEAVDGPWQAGSLGLGTGVGTHSTGAELCVLDGNAAACVRLHMSPDPGAGDAPTDEEVAAAIRQVAESVMEVSPGPASQPSHGTPAVGAARVTAAT